MSELRREGQRRELSSRKTLSSRSHKPREHQAEQRPDNKSHPRLQTSPGPGESTPSRRQSQNLARTVQEGRAWAEREGIGS